jgi:hypothetical protein
VEKFPNCKHITCIVSSAQDISANVPAILDAARQFSPPVTTLTIKVVSGAKNIALSDISSLTRLAPQLLPSLSTLELYQCELTPLTCEGLYSFSALTRLELSECYDKYKLEKGARDLAGLSRLQNLKHLSCSQGAYCSLKITDCAFLSSLTQLTYLSMDVRGSLDPISHCSSLASLTILTPGSSYHEEAQGRKDFLNRFPGFSYNFLSALVKLTSLELTVEVDLSPLSSCSSSLRSLTLNGTLPPSATAALAQLTALTFFDSYWVESRPNLDSILAPALKHLRQLQELKLPNLYYDHLEALAKARCTNLTSLDGPWAPSGEGEEAAGVLLLSSATRLQPLPHITAYKNMAWFDRPLDRRRVLPFEVLPGLESFDAASTTTIDAVLWSLAKHCPRLVEIILHEVCDDADFRSANGLYNLAALPTLQKLNLTVEEPQQVQVLTRLTQLTYLSLFIPEDEGEWPISDSELMPLLKLKMLEQLRLREGPPLSEAAAFGFVFGWQRMKKLVLDWWDEEPVYEDAKEHYLLVKEARQGGVEHVAKAVTAYNDGAADVGGELITSFLNTRITIEFPDE